MAGVGTPGENGGERRRVSTLGAALAVFGLAAACGGQDQERVGVREDATTYAEACTESKITFTDTASKTETCAGPWKYWVATNPTCYDLQPSINCPGSRYPTGKQCSHAHGGLVTRIRTGTISPDVVPQYVCDSTEVNACYRSGRFMLNGKCCYTQYVNDYASACRRAAEEWKAGFPASNLDLRSQITATSMLQFPGSSTCQQTLTNAPLFNHLAVDDTACAASTVTAPDYENPILASCRLPSVTTCLDSIPVYNGDQTVTPPGYRECFTTDTNKTVEPKLCGTAVKYSKPGMALGDVIAAEPLFVQGDATMVPVCTTGEHLPTTTAAQVRAKMDWYLGERFDQGALAQDPLLPSRLAKNTKLLLELHGDELLDDTVSPPNTSRRDAAFRSYQTRPDDRHACGAYLDPLPYSTLSVTYRSGGPAIPEWSAMRSFNGSPVATAAATPGYVYAGSYGDPTPGAGWSASSTEFIVPAAGGVLSLRYMNGCSEWGGDRARIRVVDNSTGSSTSLLDGCTYDSAWKQLSFDLGQAGLAGRSVTLLFEVYDGATLRTGTNGQYGYRSWAPVSLQFDYVSFPTVSGDTNGLLQACDRLALGDHVPASVGEALVSRCLATVTATYSFPNRQPYVDRYAEVTKALLRTVHGRIVVPGVAAGADTAEQRRPILQRHLANVAAWFSYVRWWNVFTSDSTGTVDEKLWKSTSEVVGYTWQGLHRSAYVRFKQTRVLGDYRTAGLAADREMLDALFPDPAWPAPTSTPPLTSSPALLFIADALQPTLDRLDLVSPYHDMGCRFLDCSTSGKVTELSSLYRLIGSLPDAQALARELAAADSAAGAGTSNARFFSESWPAWRATLGRVSARHAAVVVRAVNDLYYYTYFPGMLSDASAASPVPIAALGGVVQRGARRTETYAKTGLFNKQSARSLPVGLLAANIGALDAAVARAHGDLGNAIRKFNDNAKTYVDTLVAEIDDTTRTNDLEAREDLLLQRMSELSADQAGLAISATVDQARLADQNARLQAVVRSQGNRLLTQEDLGIWTIDGSDGRFSASAPATTITQLAIDRLGKGGTGGLVTTGQPGEVVNFAVTGTYQPSCALQALNGSYFGGPVNPVASGGASLANAETGSSGYDFQFSTGKFNTKSVTNSMSESWTTSVQACGEYKKGAMGFSASVKACAGYNWAKTWTESETTGKDARSTASFALGLRLPGTPFPAYPAGAILAVQLKPGSVKLADILDVQVVQQPQGTIAFGRSADLYLVVNDADCTTMGTDKRLGVTATKLVPAATSAKQIASAMDSIERYLREPDPSSKAPSIADGVIAQGRLLPDQLAALKREAWLKLQTSCAGCDVATSFDGTLRNFFETWLDWQLTHITRELERIAILRELNHVQTEATALARDLEQAGRRGRLASLLPRWSLRNVDYANAELGLATQQVVRMVSEDLHPMIALRFPEVLSGLTEPARLLGIDWVDEPVGELDTSGASLASKVYLATTEIRQRLDAVVATSARPTSNDVVEAYAVLRFPNPYDPIVSDPGGIPLPGREADLTRSYRVWDALRSHFILPPDHAPEPIRFDIRAEDLYQRGTVNALLACDFVAPAVKMMAIYIVTGLQNSTTAASLNAQSLLAPTRAEKLMWFPTGSGIEVFPFDNADYLNARTRLYYGCEDEWQARLEGKNGFSPISSYDLSETMSGISPFTSFTVDSLEALGDPWWGTTDEARDLMVVLRLEGRRKAGGVKGVLTCQ